MSPCHWLSEVSGDSYSAIGYAANLPPPTKIDRETVPYKYLTYADVDGTNWVGYLLMQHAPHPDLLVHDYAVGGARVPAPARGAVETQVNENFLAGYAMDRTAEGLPWDAADSLFGEHFPFGDPSVLHSPITVTWVGINDCA
jgi:hypothetical protein